MFLSEKQHQQYHFYLLVLFCFFLPLITRISFIVLALLMINWLLGKKQRPGKWALFFASFFGVYLLGLLFTENTVEGLRNLETKLSFLLFPFLLFTRPIRGKEKQNAIFSAFVLGCLVAGIYSLVRAGLTYLQTGQNTFFYSYLSEYLGAHPSYLAMYVSFALYLVLEETYEKWKDLELGKRRENLLLVLFFIGYIFLLTARMQILVLVFLLAFAFVWVMIRKKKMLLGLGLLLPGLALLFGLAWSIPSTKMRMKVAYEEFKGAERSENIRMPIWASGMELFQQKPLLGHGAGDVQAALNNIYQRDGIDRALRSKYNTHNQYLQTAIAGGVLALGILLAMLLIPLAMSIRRKQYRYSFFLGLFLLSMLTECFFETEKGVLFYTFFNSFLFLNMQQDEVGK